MCKKILSDGRRGERIILFADSLSNIQNLASARSDHTDEEDVLIRKLLVDVLKQGNTFTLQFIRGHVGHQGNEW